MKKFIALFAVTFVYVLTLLTIPTASNFGIIYADETDEVYTYSSTYVREVTSLMKDNWSNNYYSQITMRLNDKLMNIDNTEVEADSAFIEDGELFLPLADIAQNIGAKVTIDERTGDADIVYDKKLSRLQGEQFSSGLKGQHFSSKQAKEALNIEIQKDGNNITITNDFQTRQLIVNMNNMSKLNNNFGAVQSVSDGKGAYLLQYETEHSTRQAYSKLLQDKNIKWVEPNRIVCLPKTEETGEVSTSALTDRWGAERINADLMKDYLVTNNKTSLDLLVAVVDTGIDHNHPFLAGRINTSLGYNFISNNTNAFDNNNHGTHVAGTIVDCTTNNVKIIPVKVLGAGGGGSILQISLGVRHAADKGAKIINMSLGGAGPSSEMKNAVDYAVNKNVTVVVAAGNDAKDTVSYIPAGYDNVITVSAVDESDWLANFSNFGDAVDIAAPGLRIQSCIPDNQYAQYNGTSMATPHIAAGVACLALNNPALNPSQLKTAIQNTAIDLGSTRAFGAGVLDFRIFLGIINIPVTDLQIYKITGSSREIINSMDLLLIGDTIMGPSLMVQVTPAGATDKTITATSSNSSIAEFIDGRVVVYKSGTVTFTFKTHNNIMKTCTVKITFEDTWLAYRAAGYAGGSGTSGDPYRIATAEQLAKMAYDLNNPESDRFGNLNCKFKLIADIDLAGKNWFPATTPFIVYDRVEFDGDYHVIKNMTMSAAFTEALAESQEYYLVGNGGYSLGMRNFGLFGIAADTTIKNLGMEDANLFAPSATPDSNPLTIGILAGRIERNISIENCYVTGSIYSSIRGFFGGIVGYSYFGSPRISNCYANVGGNVQGGIVGHVDGNEGDVITITNSYATGIFSGPLSFYTGSQV
ncbi:MAG: S8 family serine peptidase, partial [Firmicutes bacterium]|nr:S8 family serine peptidase [Bacillota bacterium]